MGEDDRNYSQEIQDRIRELAHSMWEWAGRQQDMALHYWLTAEKEVLATIRAATDKLLPGEKLEKAENRWLRLLSLHLPSCPEVRRGRCETPRQDRSGRAIEG